MDNKKTLNQNGVSIVELLLVVTAIGFLVFLLGNLPNSIRLIGQAKHHSLAREIASKAIEDKRAITYANLTNTSAPGDDITSTDVRFGLLPSGSGLVLVKDCDPLLICTGGEDAKQVSVTVTWKEGDKVMTTKLDTLISKGGLNN